MMLSGLRSWLSSIRTGTLRLLDFVLLIAIAMGIAIVLRSRAHQSFWPYILSAGVVSWFAFFRGGLHPALALVPIIPSCFIHNTIPDPSSKRMATMCSAVSSVGGGLLCRRFCSSLGSSTRACLRIPRIPAQARGSDWPPFWWGNRWGSVVYSDRRGDWNCIVPSGVSWCDLTVVGVAAAIGFTVALFFATAAFPEGTVLDEVKMGALLSFIAAPLAGVAAFALRVGTDHRAGKSPAERNADRHMSLWAERGNDSDRANT